MSWSTPERRMVRRLLEAALPPTGRLAAPGDEVLDAAERAVSALPLAGRRLWRSALWALELGTLARSGTRFSELPAGGRLAALDAWHDVDLARLGLRGLLAPLELAYFASERAYETLGWRWTLPPPAPAPRPRWRDQVFDAGAQGGPVDLECDVVVVGTGAGGAPVAAELAGRGYAVVLLEEGAHFTRADFTGRASEMMRKLYRNGGLTAAYGNTVIPIPVGKAVGGTTIINSGTCFRVPESTLREWRAEGLSELRREALDPYYARVEEDLGVGPCTAEALGKTAQLIARGADALGWSHHPLARNAPGCDGQGLCCFGCPSEAKRSTDVTYVPRALEHAAQLYTGVRVERVLIDDETAVGVAGVARGPEGERVPVTARAHAVVLACGALHTPVLLLQNDLANGSGELGKNLSIHPASAALALFDEEVGAARSVPQGYAVDEFKDEGILFEGGTMPPEIVASSHPGYGPALMELMDRYDHMVSFGFLVKDTSRGRVRPGRSGEPRVSYWMNRSDLHRMQRGHALLARLYFAAGAREVHLPMAGGHRLRRAQDASAIEATRIAPRQLGMSAYHPLGTCKMGVDPLRSVVAPTHETHDVHNLFVCDGSALPGSLGVNPQLTIMAFSLRAAEHIARRLEATYARTA